MAVPLQEGGGKGLCQFWVMSGTGLVSGWGSTKMSLCKEVETWEITFPLLDIIRALLRNTRVAQQGSSHEWLSNRPAIGRQVQDENAAARAAMEISGTRMHGGVGRSFATRNLLCDEFSAAQRGDGGSAFQHAKGDCRRTSGRVAMHGARGTGGGDRHARRETGCGSAV